MPRRISECVVVITGASSGIGRATARAFAQQRATIVLASRRERPLREVEQECLQHGARALVVPTDVRHAEDVQKLARQAIDAFGRIDVWVNNAAVTLFGRFEETPADVYEEVIRTNLFGCIYGARSVLPYFREQGAGHLVNIASVVAYVSQPYTSAYGVSKAGIRAFSDSLREELIDTDIHVSTVLPATIDTPLFQHAANYTGRAPRAMPPVYPAEHVSDAILRLVRHPKREVFVGNAGRLVANQHAIAPAMTERMMARMVDRQHLQERQAPNTSGNVFEPMDEWHGVSGGWQGSRSNGGSMAGLAVAGLVAAAIPLAAYAINRQMTRDDGAQEWERREHWARHGGST